MDIISWLVLLFYPSIAAFNYDFAAAIILILKHATTLRLSGLYSKLALAQAELDYQKLNIGWRITQNFTAPPQQYSVPDFVDFIMGVSVCLLVLHSQNDI